VDGKMSAVEAYAGRPEPDEQTLDAVVRMIREVIGEDWVWETPIGPDTSFADDLGFKSIELVVLAEKLHERYGDRVELIVWISQLELDEIMRLQVGQVVSYIESVA
jgi:acyl carrier protein